MAGHCSCSHLETSTELSIIEIVQTKENAPCSDCSYHGSNMWICLYKDCLSVGCCDNVNDHSTKHYLNYPVHCIHMNLMTHRIWCYICEMEVFVKSKWGPVKPSAYQQDSDNEDATSSIVSRSQQLDRSSYDSGRGSYSTLKMEPYERRNSAASYGFDTNVGLNVQMSGDSDNSSDADETSELNGKPRGLVGLQNIGNTCYMNSALQALSNTAPLTNYFLECNAALTLASENKKPGLSRSYQRLMKDMWNKRTRGCVVPSGILYGIRSVHSMFRGYHQHDTQEFLRCFMDQLHEELKETVVTLAESHPPAKPAAIEQQPSCVQQPEEVYDDVWRRDSPSPSQSEGEYETCDSGVSERSSLSDDTERHSIDRALLERQTNEQQPFDRKGVLFHGSASSESQPSTSNINSTSSTYKKTPKYRSIISDLFDGKLLSSVQCLTCDRISTRIETFQDLSLPIPSRDHVTMLHATTGGGGEPLATCADTTRDAAGSWLGWLWGWLRSWFYGPSVSLHDCLAAFFSADELKGDNMYSCEKCNKLRNGMKFSKVMELPEVLCIHLKRFRHELMFSSKISSQVSFPLTGLDMRPYLHKDCVSTVSQYSLSSVICHHGTAGGGHYTCYALNNGAWFEFDDQYVTLVSPETVQACEAYVLFYRKNPSHIMHIRQRYLELIRQYPTHTINRSRTDDAIRFYISRQWLNRFQGCAEPGPIDNTDFVCAHGGVCPARVSQARRLSVELSQPVWEYLYDTFGGGPVCNRLYECPVCERHADALARRIKNELDAFIQLNKEFQSSDASTGTIYAISMNWFRQWQSFIRGYTDEPPDPIDNSNIARDGVIRVGSDYAQISEQLWLFFHRIYGGGPEVRLRCIKSSGRAQPVVTQVQASVVQMPVVAAQGGTAQVPLNQCVTNENHFASNVPQNENTTQSSKEPAANNATDVSSKDTVVNVSEEHFVESKPEIRNAPSPSNSYHGRINNSYTKIPTRFVSLYELDSSRNSTSVNDNVPNVPRGSIGNAVTPGQARQVGNSTSSVQEEQVPKTLNLPKKNSSENNLVRNKISASSSELNTEIPSTFTSNDKIPEFVIPGSKRPPKVYTVNRPNGRKHSPERDQSNQRYPSLKNAVSMTDTINRSLYSEDDNSPEDLCNGISVQSSFSTSVSSNEDFVVNHDEVEVAGSVKRKISNPGNDDIMENGFPVVHGAGKLKKNNSENDTRPVYASHKGKNKFKKGGSYKARKSLRKYENIHGDNVNINKDTGEAATGSLK